MASGPSVQTAIEILNTHIVAGTLDCRLWTVAPAFDGTGGTEVTGGGYSPAVFTTQDAEAGGSGQIAKVRNDAFYFSDLPVASTSVVAVSLHKHATGEMVWLNNSWTSPGAWAVGGSPLINPVDFVVIVPVSA